MKYIFTILFYLMFSTSLHAAITDGKFTTAQTWDVQWYISGGTLYASNFNNLYVSVSYTTQTNSAHRLTDAQQADISANGRYLQFFNSTTHPGTYGLASYNADGTVYKILHNTGSFRALADGAIFYNGNNSWGTLITLDAGYFKGNSGNWTVEISYPTSTQLANYTYDNTEPLAAGETASAPAPATPIYISGITQQQSNRKTSALTGIQGHKANANITGDSNLINIDQIGDGHYLTTTINGGNNTVDIIQSSTIVGIHHYLETTVVGNTNNLNILQDGNANKTAFVSLTGNNITADIDQTGLGSHYLDLNILGDNHDASVIQQGSGNHSATIYLDGSQTWTFSLDQNSATNQIYSLPHGMSDGSTISGTCSVIGGCNLTVTQQ